MEIVIHAMGMPFNGETINKQSLGGSESAAYYTARELAARGHRVQLWTNDTEGGEWDGVLYTHVGEVTQNDPLGEKFTFYATRTPHDVLIVQRHPLAFHKDFASKLNIWQLHDVAMYRTLGVSHGGLPRVDVTTGVSQWHVDQIREVYGLGKEAIRPVINAVDPELYAQPFESHPTVEGLKADGKFVLLYQSRPERGLEHLLKPDGIMAKLKEVHSNAHLVICGYDNTQAPMVHYYQQLQAWGEQCENVTNIGCLKKQELAQLQRSCDLLIYPTTFSEVSCITAMEAMHAGLPMLTSNFAALAETCADSGTILIDLEGEVPPVALDNLIAGNAQQKIDVDAFVRQVQGLENNSKRLDMLKQRQLKAAERYTWVKAVDRLEEVIDEAFERRSTPVRTMRHLIEHSDIIVAHELSETLYGISHVSTLADPIMDQAKKELETMYSFARPDGDPSLISKHYEYWEGKNCDRLAESGKANVADEIEIFTQSTRFRGVLQFVARAINDARARKKQQDEQVQEGVVDGNVVRMGSIETSTPVRVMEFGCAHGHLLLPLVKVFPDVEFIGVDFMQRSVALATKSAVDFGLKNVEFVQRDQSQLNDELGQFDCIIAAEVLEHVWDYEALLDALRDRLNDDGAIVTTTPCGRWEWSGRESWQVGRQHLHHFECQDLLDIFSPCGLRRDLDMLYSPAEGHDGAGAQMGSWICYVQPKEFPLGTINYERKLKYLAPRETVSLCMIVKNAESTLKKSTEQVLQFVDQAIIGIDKTTTDETSEIILKLRKKFPHVAWDVFPIETPMAQGFAAARNQTLDKAVGDWILWMDADEEMPYASNIMRLLRPSAFNAYACPQIHYSAMPPQVLQTDFPMRLFRNNRGIKFYGTVHEHPEESPGNSVASCMLTGDVQFLHSGYIDETVRRNRYQRNLPLLMRDIKDNPDRFLNKYLLLRDLAQGLGFENQMTGQVTEEMRLRAIKGMETFVDLMSLKKPVLRMVVESLPFYSMCCEIAGLPGSFDATINLKVVRAGSPSMTAATETKGRFADRKTYFQFINLIIEESTKHYESKYA